MWRSHSKPHPEHAITIVPLALIKPIHRNPGVDLDFGGFERERLARILRWIASGEPVEPVQVQLEPEGQFQYSVYDGFHRYHAAVAAGFIKIPVAVGKWGFSWDQ